MIIIFRQRQLTVTKLDKLDKELLIQNQKYSFFRKRKYWISSLLLLYQFITEEQNKKNATVLWNYIRYLSLKCLFFKMN